MNLMAEWQTGCTTSSPFLCHQPAVRPAVAFVRQTIVVVHGFVTKIESLTILRLAPYRFKISRPLITPVNSYKDIAPRYFEES